MPDTVEARPLWRVGTTLARELQQRGEAESVQRAFLSEVPMHLIVEELERRGHTKLWDGERWLVCVTYEADR